MSKFFHFGPVKFRPKAVLTGALVVVAMGVAGWRLSALQSIEPSARTPGALLVEGFRHVEAASVSDAVEQITGHKMFMTHRMRPIFTTKFAGFAVTVVLEKEEGHQGSPALGGMLAAIDHGGPDSVYVMVVQDGADVAGMGGLMGTAMAARDFAGAVIDGGVRDVSYLRKIHFPVFALGIVPSTSVNHYRFAGADTSRWSVTASLSIPMTSS